MNVAKAIEIALAEVIRNHSGIDPEVTIRAWQTLGHDATWRADVDRTFPVIEVRASPPRTNEQQGTLTVDAAILIGTNTADDMNHGQISDLYERVQDCIDNLYGAFRRQGTSDEYTTFTSAMSERVHPAKFTLGGFTYGDPQVPFEDRGANMIGIALVTHFSRTDF